MVGHELLLAISTMQTQKFTLTPRPGSLECVKVSSLLDLTIHFWSSGFITDGNSKLVGSAQVRQVRVRESSCLLASQLQTSLNRCHAPYSLDVEDLSDYGEVWNASNLNSSNGFSQAWQYQSQSQRRGYPIWGKLTVYQGGGYVVPLGTDHQSASR